MDNKEAAMKVTDAVRLIIKVQSLEELKNIDNNFDVALYPEIKFRINETEILKGLLKSNELDIQKLSDEVNKTHSSVYLKLLYSLAWKQGDLSKLNNIIIGSRSTKRFINIITS